MGRTIHASDESWHGSIEDLLEVIELPRIAGPGPFAIHLQTSTAPIGKSKELPSFDGLHVYRLMRHHEGRSQFQLRLGIIETDLQADAILATVLEHYPGAMKKAVDEDDRAAIARKVRRSARSAESAIAVSNAAAPCTPVPPKAATEQPRTAIESVEDLRWNIDELLPCLAKMYPLRLDQTSRNRIARATPPHVEGAQLPRNSVEPVRAAPNKRTGLPRSEVAATAARPAQGLEPRAVSAPGVANGAGPAIDRAHRESSMSDPAPSERKARRLDSSAGIKNQPQVARASPTTSTVRKQQQGAAVRTTRANAVNAATAVASADKSTADAEALQSIVTRIGTLIDAVEAHQGANDVRRQAAAPAVLAAPTATPASVVSEPTKPIPSTQTLVPSATPIPNPPTGSPAVLTAPVAEHDRRAIATASRGKSADSAPPTVNTACPDARSAPPALTKTPGAPAVGAEKRAGRVDGAPAPVHELDATRTIRALRPAELADEEAGKWFAIQLSLSEGPWCPDDVPALDLFDVYCLYAVIAPQQGQVMHALRVGFFSEEAAAQIVADYLRRHFESAGVTRVSMAERERFMERRFLACKDIGATGLHAMIELATPPVVPETRLADLSARPIGMPKISRRVRTKPE